MSSAVAPVLVAGQWQAADRLGTFQALDPTRGTELPTLFPVSGPEAVAKALDAADRAFADLCKLPGERRAAFLEAFANRIDRVKEELATVAQQETGLARDTRLMGTEIPRTVDQIRQAAAAIRERSWCLATIDTKNNLRSMYLPLGPAVLIGPNNFPFAYNAVSGGDFAAALAAGCSVIAKGHPSHPHTTRKLAEEAFAAVQETGLPPATLQVLYHVESSEGQTLVTDRRVGSVAFTGSRRTGLLLKSMADRVGKPIFLELGSLNPVVLLPGSLRERFDQVLETVSGSCLLGMGQFCTNPGLLFLLAGADAERFLAGMVQKYESTPTSPLLSRVVQQNLSASIAALRAAGAELLTGGTPTDSAPISHHHTLMTCSGRLFLERGHALQQEAFGNATLVVLCTDLAELKTALASLEGQLAGSLFSHTDGSEDELAAEIAALLRQRVGRLLNDKMTTGVTVSAAQCHGGPYPATGHPHFTAVGFPASIRRFCMLACFDNVRQHRLPSELRDENPTGQMWRLVDGTWTR
ncbi:MAG TPA: aldehyde dehydrogenase family protein [Gemmatales bacterium]|nr:aldehyde dehydrogenase family protein [Gemmatales bacterium]HMP58920.1 aldehyde dehydrogenase family protein [Gemmatales bacterium]